MTGDASPSTAEALQSEPATQRNRRPVFVTGCHRSGTNLLYDNLLSAGGFADYRGYLPVYETLIPHFGSLDNLHNRKRIVDTWLRSKGFARSGVTPQEVAPELLSEASTGGKFLSITMAAIARKQGVSRWAVYNPDNLLYIPEIKAEIPDAIFIHILRDGRDIALSLKKMGGFTPFLWSGQPRGLMETALYWEWTVQKGRSYGRKIPSDYIEIRYEDLVTDPASTLARLGDFLDHDLDYERILEQGRGRAPLSNSSFRDEVKPIPESPVNRWKKRLSHEEVAALESLVGASLVQFGYELTAEQTRSPLWHAGMSAPYRSFLDAKFWLKHHTPLGRLAALSVLELPEDDSATP